MSVNVFEDGKLIPIAGNFIIPEGDPEPPLVIDTELSETSENPLQNRIITASFAQLKNDFLYKKETITDRIFFVSQ